MVPSEESLKASLESPQALAEHFKKENQTDEVEQLLERTSERNQKTEEKSAGMLRVDLMKVNSLEIIITFYMSAHLPLQDVNKFVLSEE